MVTGELRDKMGGLKKEVVIWEYERGLLYRDGKLDRVLEPGRYEFWTWETVCVLKISMRQMSEVITSQAMLTKDKVEVRLSMVAQYAVLDPALAVNAVESYQERLYQDLQLTLRDVIAGYEIDQLVETREELGTLLLASVAASALTYGVEVRRVGIRDIILPGSVKTVFMQEVEADRQGRADLVRARHEVAAARARANTAKILSEHPNVARMQELDALVKLAGRSGSVLVLPNMADLLVSRSGEWEESENGNGKKS